MTGERRERRRNDGRRRRRTAAKADHLSGGETARKEGIKRGRLGTRGDVHREAQGLTSSETGDRGGETDFGEERGDGGSMWFGRREGEHHVERGEANLLVVTTTMEEQRW